MKENKGKEVVDGATRPEAQSQPRPSAGDKRKTLPRTLDLGNLPSRQGKKAKHGSSRPETLRPNLPSSQLSIPIVDVDLFVPLMSLLPRPLLPPCPNLPKGSL